eukprot:2457018-Pleurochrysis_carterae.AAC.5
MGFLVNRVTCATYAKVRASHRSTYGATSAQPQGLRGGPAEAAMLACELRARAPAFMGSEAQAARSENGERSFIPPPAAPAHIIPSLMPSTITASPLTCWRRPSAKKHITSFSPNPPVSTPRRIGALPTLPFLAL